METNHQNEQTVTERHLTITEKSGCSQQLPDIRVGGKWLEKLGFQIGKTVTLYVEHGKIIIVADKEPVQRSPDHEQARKDAEALKRMRAKWKNWRNLRPGEEQEAWFRGARSPGEAAALSTFQRSFPTKQEVGATT